MQKGNLKTAKPAKNVLNDKHERFCQEYLIDLNASAAYLRAGYNAGQKGSYVLARRLLQKVNITARIQELMNARAERLSLTAGLVLEELSKLVFANIEGHITEDKDGKITIKPTEKLKAIELAMRHLSLFNDKQTLEIPQLEQLLAWAEKEVEKIGNKKSDK